MAGNEVQCIPADFGARLSALQCLKHLLPRSFFQKMLELSLVAKSLIESRCGRPRRLRHAPHGQGRFSRLAPDPISRVYDLTFHCSVGLARHAALLLGAFARL